MVAICCGDKYEGIILVEGGAIMFEGAYSGGTTGTGRLAIGVETATTLVAINGSADADPNDASFTGVATTRLVFASIGAAY